MQSPCSTKKILAEILLSEMKTLRFFTFTFFKHVKRPYMETSCRRI